MKKSSKINSKKFKNTLILVVLAGLVISLAYLSYKEKIFADVPISGDNPGVKIRQIPLFSSSEGGETSQINMTVARGQKESFEVVLDNNSSQNFSDLTIYKEDLSSGSGDQLSKNDIDERVVHNWQQKIIIPGDIAKHNTFRLGNIDELLVKNDKTDFLSDQIGITEDTLLSSSGSVKAKVSDSRLEPISMTLKGNSSRKFIFSITVPSDKSGQFEGNIMFVDTTKNQTVKSLNLKLNILKGDLVSPAQKDGKNIGCFVNDQIANDPSVQNPLSGNMVSEQTFISRMKVAKETGCDSLILRFGYYTDINKMLEAVSGLGFNGPAILNYYYASSDGIITNGFGANAVKNNLIVLNSDTSANEFKDLVTKIKDDNKITVPIMFYGLDEPNLSSSGANQGKFDANKQRIENTVRLVKEVLGDSLESSNISPKVVSAANLYASQQIFSLGGDYFSGMSIEGVVEGASWGVGSFSDRLNEISQGQPLMGIENYYFQGWEEYPITNRFNSGFGFIKTGMSGFYVNPLWGYYGKNKPLYLEDATHPVDSTDPTVEAPSMKQMMTFYPASDGLIPTVQSEGLREGILDTKYYLTYQNDRKKVAQNCPQNAQALEDISSRIDQDLNQYKWDPRSEVDLSTVFAPEKFESTRNLIKNYLEEFSNVCSSDTVVPSKGFSIFSPTGDLAASLITDKELKVFSYSPDQGRWLIAPKDEFELKAGQSYYIYNSSSNYDNLALDSNPSSSANRPLGMGWNLISSSGNLSLSKIETNIQDDQDKCSKNVNLQVLVNLGYASRKIYIINDDKTSDPEKAFKLYGNGSDQLDRIPQGKGFWIYLYKMPKTTDMLLKDFDCR